MKVLVIMDLTLPGLDSVAACLQMRTFSDDHVIMLTGRDSEIDRLIGLSVGADDYVTKPIYARQLVARISAMQRRPRAPVNKDLALSLVPCTARRRRRAPGNCAGV